MTRQILVGSVPIGGGAPVAIQSMLNTKTTDVEGSLEQLKKLASAGCQIARLAVPNKQAAETFGEICKLSPLPLVADIHFDYKLALLAAEGGASKIRINPGNIGKDENVKAVADACKSRGVPIRIGVNSGSVEKEILAKFGGPTPEAMAESAMYHVRLLEKYDFDDIVISIKSSNVTNMIEAYKRVAEICDYPLHLGVTEAGTQRMGLIKSSIGIGSLLTQGIGDTIRVSLTADPIQEIYAGFDILKSIGLDNSSPRLVSCPTCGRTKIDLIGLANEVEERLRGVKKNITVAVMGCVVNGPGEAREADIGIAGGDNSGIIFKKGEILRKVSEDEIIDELMKEIDLL